MDKIFQRLLRDKFSDLKGAVVDATVPVPNYLINELTQAALQGNKTIESCQVVVHSQNRVSATVKTTLLPWSIHLKLKLDDSVDFASYSSPKIRAWLENNILLGRLSSWLNALPEGIKIYGEQLVLDLDVFLETPEQKQMLSLIKSVGIRTEENTVILDVKIEVD